MNERALLSMGRMRVDEGFRVSRMDLKINGTSVVPYALWSENTTRKTKGQSEENKENGRLLTEKGIRFWTSHSSSSRLSGVWCVMSSNPLILWRRFASCLKSLTCTEICAAVV